MQHQVSAAYLAERRGGPLRAGVMLSLVFVFLACVTYWQHAHPTKESVFPTLAITGVTMAVIWFFVSRRMMKMTGAMDKLAVIVTSQGLELHSPNGRFAIPANEIRSVTMYQTMLSPKVAYFVLLLDHGRTALPPIETADALAQEIRDLLPSIPFTTKRALSTFLRE